MRTEGRGVWIFEGGGKGPVGTADRTYDTPVPASRARLSRKKWPEFRRLIDNRMYSGKQGGWEEDCEDVSGKIAGRLRMKRC